MITCYRELDWPKLPTNMVKELVEYSKNQVPIMGGINASYNPLNKELPVYSILYPPDYLVDWKKNNLSFIDRDHIIGIQRFVGVEEIPIHIDSIRGYAYNNVLTNDPTITCFYKEKEPSVRVKYTNNTWYYHNTSIPHNITNLKTKFRVAVTIFKPEPSMVGTSYELSNEGREFLKNYESNH